MIFQAYHDGENISKSIIESAGKGLAMALIDAANLLDPDVIVIGGGVAKEQPELVRLIKEFAPSLNIKAAVLGGKLSGIFGAIALSFLREPFRRIKE